MWCSDDDRRQSLREEKDGKLEYRVQQCSGREDDRAVCSDGSPAGVRFRSRRFLPINTRLFLQLQDEAWLQDISHLFPSDASDGTEVAGTVIWCRKSEEFPDEFDVGVSFTADR